MCGIGGLVMRDGGRPEAAMLDRLAAAIAHRGPDGSGRFTSAPVRIGAYAAGDR